MESLKFYIFLFLAKFLVRLEFLELFGYVEFLGDENQTVGFEAGGERCVNLPKL